MPDFDPEAYVASYLPPLGTDPDAFFSLIDGPAAIQPILAREFRSESDSREKARILEVIWQHRDPALVPVLAEALGDPSPFVWKEALNGLVALTFPNVSRCWNPLGAAALIARKMRPTLAALLKKQ